MKKIFDYIMTLNLGEKIVFNLLLLWSRICNWGNNEKRVWVILLSYLKCG